ncbi:MAG: S9 family peptidase [Opitutaceae bacterium]|nr:S9 family peptidase [Opitutaceae bacterium]
MPRVTLRTILATVMFAGGVCFAAEKIDLSRVAPVSADQPIPTQDFLRPALFQRPEPNDGGTHLAALVPLAADKTGLIVIDLRNLEAKPMLLSLSHEYSVDTFDWLTDDRLLCHASSRESGDVGTFVAHVSRGLGNYPVIEGAGTSLVGVPDARKERPQLMVRWDIAEGHGRKGHVIEVNTDVDLSVKQDTELTGNSSQARRNRNDLHIAATFPDLGSLFETGFLSDKAGELAFALTMDDGVAKVHHLVSDKWKECPIDLDSTEIVSYGDKPGELIVLGPRQPGKPRALRYMDAPSGTSGDVIWEDPGYEFNGWLIRDPRTHQLLGLGLARTGPVTVWFSEQYRSVQKFLEGNFPGKVVRPWPADPTGSNIFLEVYSDRQPSIFYLANLEKKTLSVIKNSAPWIDPQRMLPMSAMKFRTAEGAKLDAYVTLPVGASKEKPVPLIVLPHASPWGRDTLGFDGEAQFFASRGFAVLQPNYRGSAGTDWMFPYEDRWAFRKMHDDVTAATRTVLKTGLIDPDRVAIVGWRFGGYLAMAGVAFEPSLYRCAATVSGTFDWAERLEELRITRFDDPEYGQLTRWLGSTKEQAERYAAMSPARHVGQVRVPVLVAYDKDDRPLVVNESRRLIDALKKYDVPHTVITATGENPGWGHFGEQVELYDRIAAFLHKHLGPADSAAK